MRKLFLLRGLPATGKSHFIDRNDLTPYTLSSDNIRTIFGGLDYDLICNGSQNKYHNLAKESISQKQDKKVWSFLRERLNERAVRGETIFVDATHYNRKSMNTYAQIKKQYGYKICVIDFNVDESFIVKDEILDNAIRQNENRSSYKRVPNQVIRKMYNTYLAEKSPSGFNDILPCQVFEELSWKKHDLNNYKRVQFIGDIHGCYSALKDCIGDELDPNTFYVFLGDYIDRGIENVEVMEFLLRIMKEENVLLLEGNHEIHLRKFIYGEPLPNTVTRNETIPELMRGGITKKDLKEFIRCLKPFYFFEFQGKTWLATHGGVTPDILWYDGKSMIKAGLIPDSTYIKGIGKYSDDIDLLWDQFCSDELNKDHDMYQIHGHRNIFDHSVKNFNEDQRSFNLEQKVEAGGKLGSIILEDNQIKDASVKNNVFSYKEAERNLNFDITLLSNKDIMQVLENSRLINKKRFNDHLYAYNFTQDAFFGSKWNNFVIMARGLFLRHNGDIEARGFKKFFNIGETDETLLDNSFYDKIKYPVRRSLKEDGFLGLVSWDATAKYPIITSKGGSNEHGKYLKNLIMDHLNKGLNTYQAFMDIIEKHKDVTFLFECISNSDMPHIVGYNREKVVLISAINNDYTDSFNQEAFEELAENCSFDTPEEEIISTEDRLISCLASDDNETWIEGYVYRDASGFMFKSKTQWFKKWKEVRSKLHFYSKNQELFKSNHILNELKVFEKGVKEVLVYLSEHPEFQINDLCDKEVNINIKTIREKYFE